MKIAISVLVKCFENFCFGAYSLCNTYAFLSVFVGTFLCLHLKFQNSSTFLKTWINTLSGETLSGDSDEFFDR